MGVVSSVMPQARQEADAVFFSVQLDELAGHGGTGHNHRPQRGQIARLRLQIAVQAHPYGGDARGKRDPFILD